MSDQINLDFLHSDVFKIILKDVVRQSQEESAAMDATTSSAMDSTIPRQAVFYVHKSLLATLSTELDKHVNNDMKEGTEGVMELSDVDELTMKAFLQWVYYKGEYTIENPKASSSLLKHTKVYVLADRFNIVPLKDLSYNQITTLLADLGMVAAADDVEAVMAAVSFAFGNLPFSSSTLSSITAPTERLLKYFAHYTSWALDVFRTNAELCSLLEHSPDFAKALVTNSRSAPTAPWAASTIDSGSESKGTMTLTASYTGDKSHILHRGCARPECSYTGVMIIQCPSCKKVDSEIGGSIQFKGSILGTVEQDRITGTKTSYSYKCKWCNVKSDMGGTRGEKLFCRKCLYGSQDWVMT